ncbi:alpha/beta hydrolase [Pseudomonadales bacterium]|nr:alpha/beta hydrolase [Pseudomonadales bacterium]
MKIPSLNAAYRSGYRAAVATARSAHQAGSVAAHYSHQAASLGYRSGVATARAGYQAGVSAAHFGYRAGNAAARAGHQAANSGYRTGVATARAGYQAGVSAAHFGYRAGNAAARAVNLTATVASAPLREAARPVVRGAIQHFQGASIGSHANMPMTPAEELAQKSSELRSDYKGDLHRSDYKGVLREKTAALGEHGELARQNLMSLIRLRGSVMEHRAGGVTPNVDVGVHGTFDHNAPWTKTDSAEMAALGNGRDTLPTNFQWTGSGLEAKRQSAGKQLSDFVEDVRKIAGEETHLTLAGHSHGGNVIGHAMTHQAGTNRGGVDDVVMLGTPMMTNREGVNLSWSSAGADKVRGEIISAHNTVDQVQTTAAFANEFGEGRTRNYLGTNNRAVAASGRQFDVDSQTKQTNLLLQAQSSSGADAHNEMHSSEVLSKIADRLSSRNRRT